MLSTRVRKSPLWHLSVEEGVRQSTIYSDMYHPRAYIDPEEGGLEAEYELRVNDVTLIDVAVERQIRVAGPDAEAFVNYVITRDATDIPLDDSIYDADVDVEFDVHLPDEYAEVSGEPVHATLATVPFKESVNPSARERAKIHARDGMDE